MLIGLHGEAESGKDQSFEYIQEWSRSSGRVVRRDAFADRLKLSAAKALGYEGTLEQCVALCNQIKQPGWEIIVREPDRTVEHVISGREYLQYYGTEAHRDVFDEDFWTTAVLRGYDRYDRRDFLVITDVRFPNEARAVRAIGGHIWQLVRPDVRLQSDHASERPLPPELIDRVINNDRGLSKLRKRVRAAVKYETEKALVL